MRVPFDDDDSLLEQLRDSPELLERIEASTLPELGLQKQLRLDYSPALISEAMELLVARKKAAAIGLPGAENLWITPRSLEQATSWQVAEHKAARFPAGEGVLDLCSGIGVDTFAMLQRGPVESVDVSASMVERCGWNVETWALALSKPELLQRWSGGIGNANTIDVGGRLLHVDPDRRTRSERPARRLEHYNPPLDRLQEIARTCAGGALKLGPASNFMQKFPGCEIELISLNGECREATVWMGSLAGDATFRATSLPTGETLAADPLSAWASFTDKPCRYVFDPDPAIVRSGLLDVLSEQQGLQRLDKEDEYATSDTIPDTAFVAAFEVEAVLGNNDKELRRHLRTNPSSSYEIKCRHLKVDANALRKKLPKGDASPRVILYARINGKARTIVAQRIT